MEGSGVKLPSRSGGFVKSTNRTTLDSAHKTNAVHAALAAKAAKAGASAPLPSSSSAPVGSAAPILRLQKSGDFVVLLWPREFADFQLEATESLTPFPVWEPVLEKAVAASDQMAVALPIRSALRFYRLRRP